MAEGLRRRSELAGWAARGGTGASDGGASGTLLYAAHHFPPASCSAGTTAERVLAGPDFIIVEQMGLSRRAGESGNRVKAQVNPSFRP